MFGKAKKRTNELKDLASQLDLDFAPKDEYGIFNKLADFQLIKRGNKRSVTNILALKDDFKNFDARIFDFTYAVSNGKSSTVYQQTVLFVESYRLALPEFWMFPEHILYRLGNWFGVQDIDFDAFPQYSANYQLRGSDEYYIRAKMNDDVLHHFSTQKGWHLEGANYYLLFYQQSRLFQPSEMEQFIEHGKRVFKFFKNPDDAFTLDSSKIADDGIV